MRPTVVKVARCQQKLACLASKTGFCGVNNLTNAFGARRYLQAVTQCNRSGQTYNKVIANPARGGVQMRRYLKLDWRQCCQSAAIALRNRLGRRIHIT
jgi:hypothetical protein